MPQPMKILFIAFSVTVTMAEIIRAFIKNTNWIKWAGIAPLLAALAAIFPYRGDLEYFGTGHQVLMFLIVFMGVIYWIENRFQLRKTL
jgi:hypothetical protein